MLDTAGTLMARALQGLNPSLKGVARGVAIVIGISVSIAAADRVEASNVAYKDLTIIADYQLTTKQFNCHNEIVFRESSNNALAISGSHYGFYQMRTTAAKTPDAYKQFITYWYYVSKRYGITQYDEPNYCKALDHLRKYQWQ